MAGPLPKATAAASTATQIHDRDVADIGKRADHRDHAGDGGRYREGRDDIRATGRGGRAGQRHHATTSVDLKGP